MEGNQEAGQSQADPLHEMPAMYLQDMFKKMKELFPGPKPAPGTGTVRLTRRPLTPAGSPNGVTK